jgi:hypothetical protein
MQMTQSTEPADEDPEPRPPRLHLVPAGMVGRACQAAGPAAAGGPIPAGLTLRHRTRAFAAAAELPAGAALSHVSAACLHGLPIVDEVLLQLPVQATHPGPGRGYRRHGVQLRAGRLEPDEITHVDGVPVTTVVRTLVDLGRWATLESAVVAADAALRDGLVSREDLDEAVVRAAGSLGVARARIVMSFADGRPRTVGESRARVATRWPNTAAVEVPSIR